MNRARATLLFLVALYLFAASCTSLPNRFEREPNVARGVEVSDFSVVREPPQEALPWRFLSSDRTVAIGDIHGDLDALISILREARLIDANGGWIGGSAQVVINGDVVDKGPNSRSTLDFIIALQADIKRSGRGALHFLYGNHEVMLARGDFHGSSKADIRAMEADPYLKFKDKVDVQRNVSTRWKLKGVQDAWDLFQTKSLYGEFFSKQHALVQVGDTIFVHAGLGTWALDFDPADINATARAWMKFYLSHNRQTGRPKVGTEWVVAEYNEHAGFDDNRIGPIFGREMAPRENNPAQKRRMDLSLSDHELDQFLKERSAKRVVMGHVPWDSEITEHPYYGPKVQMIDTRISRWSDPKKRGNLRWLEVGENGALSYKKTKLSDEVLERGHPIRLNFQQRISSASQSAAAGCTPSLKLLLKTFGR